MLDCERLPYMLEHVLQSVFDRDTGSEVDWLLLAIVGPEIAFDSAQLSGLMQVDDAAWQSCPRTDDIDMLVDDEIRRRGDALCFDASMHELFVELERLAELDRT